MTWPFQQLNRRTARRSHASTWRSNEERLRRLDRRVWWFGLGYFASYVPYSGLAKALSQGLVPGMRGPVAGLELLPATIIGTAIAMPFVIWCMGGWKFAEGTRVLGVWIPGLSSTTALSGAAFSLIIATTTLAYTFGGISIVLALLLMRGGILVMAPVVDLLRRRRVAWYSWTALVLSLVALAVALSDVVGYHMSVAAAINLGGYLSGYALRLHFMTASAKSEDAYGRVRYLVEECFAAMVVLLAIPGILALLGWTDGMMQLRRGFTTFLMTPQALPALMVGVFYGFLGVFGTLIYLDRRENTFCIPVFCSFSLLSGLVASFALTALVGDRSPGIPQLAAAGIIVLAILILAVAPRLGSIGVRTPSSSGRAALTRLYVFVCSGNTSRSPMAQFICRDEIAARLGVSTGELERAGYQVVSAGLTAKPGMSMTADAGATLGTLGFADLDHSSRDLTAELVHQSEAVFCMTRQHRETIRKRFPEAEGKVHLLDPGCDIDDPSGAGLEGYMRVALRIQRVIRLRVSHFALADS